MAEPLAGTLARILEQNRSRYNSKFALVKSQFPKLADSVFAAQLSELVQPLVELADQKAPDKTTSIVDAYFDLALELCGREVFGGASRYSSINVAWHSLLPSLTALIVANPRRVVGAITNAVYTLSNEPSASPQEWILRMSQAAPLCSDIDTLLQVGQATAWQAGMAHYRQAALSLCQSLSPALVRIALGIPTDTRPVEQIIAQMSANPWYQPASWDTRAMLKIVKRAGAFRGFGGVFVAPPTVFASGDGFMASDGENTWLLHADAFGATFHRAEPTPRADKPPSAYGYKVVTGTVSKGTTTAAFDGLEIVTSLAANATTLAITTPYTHVITLIALA